MEETELPLHLQARNYLLGIIKSMAPGRNRLESENALAARLGMSRETVRKAMTSLIEEGCITRRHGKGNFGHPAVANLAMRIDKNSDFRRLLASRGYAVRARRSQARRTRPSEEMLKRMGDSAGSEVVAFDLEFLADDRTAIRGRVELLASIVESHPPAGEYQGNIGEVFSDHCSDLSNHTTAWLLAELSPESCAAFGLPRETPLLAWEEVYYNLHERRLGYVKIWFNPELMDLSLLLTF